MILPCYNYSCVEFIDPLTVFDWKRAIDIFIFFSLEENENLVIFIPFPARELNRREKLLWKKILIY